MDWCFFKRQLVVKLRGTYFFKEKYNKGATVSLTFLELCSSTNYLFHSAEIKLGLQRGGLGPSHCCHFSDGSEN